MMDEIKSVINELNKQPFNKVLNLVTYDSLRGDQRLDLLMQVISEIDPKLNNNLIRVGDPEEFVATILDMLRIMKYMPPNHLNSSDFRQSLILGDRDLVTHILNWLLTRLPLLKKRAYLAQFLVKIELSPDVEGDHEVLILYQQYQRMIDEFKAVHNTYENLKKTIGSVHEMQRDVKAMEDEKEQISHKLTNIKRRVDVNTNLELFSLVKVYIEEKDKNDKLLNQCNQQDIELQQLQQKLNRLEPQLSEAKNNFQYGSTSQHFIDRMDEEVKIKQQLLKQVLPSELQQLQQYVHDIEDIESQPAISVEYLTKINVKIQNINREINNIIERKMLNSDPMEDKLSLFRQNASVVAKKRETITESLINTEYELKKLQEDIKQKRIGLKDGEEPLRGESLKQYINSLRERSTNFKNKRNELAEIKTESEIMENTLDILKTKEKNIIDTLISLEEQKGISGYFSMQENNLNKTNDENIMQTVEQINEIIKQLSNQINEKKAILAPIIKDLRPLRQKSIDLQSEYEMRKQTYDSCAAGLESNLIKLQNEIKHLITDISANQSNQYLMECQLEVLNTKQELVNDQITLNVSQDPQEKQSSMLIKIQNELNVELLLKDKLKQQQKDLKDNEAVIMKQLKMWKDLQALFEAKKLSLKHQIEKNKDTNTKRDHLIL